MKADLAELKYQVHAARVALEYQLKTQRTERYGDRAEQIAKARDRLEAAQKAYQDAQPEPVSMRVRSPYFIGPKMKRGKRGDGPTIQCFRCEEVKPTSEYYDKGTVCIACVVKRSKEWAERNPDSCKSAKKRWQFNNRESHNEAQRNKRAADPVGARAKDKEKRKNNRLSINKSQREYLRRRKKRDPRFRALLVCRQRLWILRKSAGVKKKLRCAEMMGISRDGFFAHMQSLFLPGMSWDNYGKGASKWNVEHSIPCRNFDHSDIEQAKACWHYTNLRPMWEPANLSKSDFLPCGARARDKKKLLTT